MMSPQVLSPFHLPLPLRKATVSSPVPPLLLGRRLSDMTEQRKEAEHGRGDG